MRSVPGAVATGSHYTPEATYRRSDPVATALGTDLLITVFAINLRVLLVYGRFIMVSKRAQPAAAQPFKPTKQQLIEAEGKTVRDVIGPGLRVLFCGINPGLYTAAVGHHFARPGNRFWPALYRSGFTNRLLSPFEEIELLP